MKKATLVLQDGTTMVGQAFGAPCESLGEIAFTTSMAGNVEMLTDPRCIGKLLMPTFATIGGYGVIPEDFVCDTVQAQGMIVRAFCEQPSNYRSKGNLDQFLKEQGIPGIAGLDTRALMIGLRGAGVQKAAIVQGECIADAALLERILQYSPAIPTYSDTKLYPNDGPHIAVVNLGLGHALAEKLHSHGAKVTLLPTFASIGTGYDAIALSDGSESYLQAENLPSLPKNLPLYGEGVGHLLIARLLGGTITRMNTPHGGANLPVKWGERVYTTQQFHTYAVTAPPKGASECFYNVNDATIEGLRYATPPALTVQFPPYAQDGPSYMGFLYDSFLAMVKEVSLCR